MHSGLERVPREAGAFHAHGILTNAAEDRQLAERVGFDLRARRRGHQPVERVEQLVGLVERLALERVGHQRRRRLGDRAAGALEPQILDHVALEVEVDRDFVAAQRVVALRVAVVGIRDPEIPGSLVVIQDDFLVELS